MTQQTPNGIQVGTTVKFNDGFTGTREYQVTEILHTGLHVRLDGVEWTVNYYDCQPIPPAADASPDFPTLGAEKTWTNTTHSVTVRREHAGFTVTATEISPYPEVAGQVLHHTTGLTETEARTLGRALVAQLRQPPARPARAERVRPVSGWPVAKGHQLDMSPSQAEAILTAGEGGWIRQGAPMLSKVRTGDLTTTQLRAAAARGWLTLTTVPRGRRTVVTGGTVTTLGVRRAGEALSLATA